MSSAMEDTIADGATLPMADGAIDLLDDDAEGASGHRTVDAQVLEREEHRRRVGGLISLLGSYCITSVVLLLLSRQASIFWPLTLLTLANAVFAGVLLAIARKRRYSDLVSAGIGVSAATVALAGGVYMGVASGTVVGLPALVYYFGSGDSALRRRVVFGFVLLGYLLIVSLMLVGVIPPRGIALPNPDHRLEYYGAAALALIVLQILVLTYRLARKSRHSTLLAMAALERARERIRQRDALLAEANADLDRALGVGGRVGRYSGHVIGSFDVGDVIGRGAIGEVYEARHATTKQPAAVKVLHLHLQTESGHLQRFFREVQIARTLRSAHIPRILESGSAPDGGPYLAMELLRGTDLATELRHRKRLPIAEVDDLVAQLASALDEAHASGIVHRDIKPQNLFRVEAPAPVWKILDFGVSKLAAFGGTLTGGAAVGTPAYMAPEQVAGDDVDPRADLFALTSVIYRAVTGRPAFSGPSDLVTMLRVTRWQPWRPSDLAGVGPDLDAFFALGFAKDRARRFQSAADLAATWVAARSGTLDARLRSDARSLLAEHPWGTEQEPESSSRTRVRQPAV
ncbi:MAG: serine/threonine-protein kinase [Polyangiaceae bacterium]